jgi:AcrR family transcriptional regulator
LSSGPLPAVPEPTFKNTPAGPARSAPRPQRADARANRDRILAVARTVVAEQGTDASLRDIARRAEVGLGTLYRHFPTREALLEALLRDGFDRLAERGQLLRGSHPPLAALTLWLTQFSAGAGAYRGLPSSLLATLKDQDSALAASCAAMRQTAADLLADAQAADAVRPDVDAIDLFALINAIASVRDLAPSLADRGEHLLAIVIDGLTPRAATTDAR